MVSLLVTCHFFVGVVAPLGILLGSLEEFFGLLWEGELQRGVANLTFKEILEQVPFGLLGVELEGVLSFGLKHGVVTVQVPVTGFNGHFGFVLGRAHTFTDTVVDTG